MVGSEIGEIGKGFREMLRPAKDGAIPVDDRVAGDPDMSPTAKRLSSGEAVWAAESYGQELTTPFGK